jgi:hypothetical protein
MSLADPILLRFVGAAEAGLGNAKLSIISRTSIVSFGLSLSTYV